MPRIGKSIDKAPGKMGRIGSDCLMSTEVPFGVIKIFWKYIVVMVAQYCECIKCH